MPTAEPFISPLPTSLISDVGLINRRVSLGHFLKTVQNSAVNMLLTISFDIAHSAGAAFNIVVVASLPNPTPNHVYP